MSPQSTLQSESRRPDSNRGPLHYEGTAGRSRLLTAADDFAALAGNPTSGPSARVGTAGVPGGRPVDVDPRRREAATQ